MKVLGICGSLRTVSLNRMLLNATIELAPEGMEIVPSPPIGELPHYNNDLDDSSRLGGPAPVAALKVAIHEADGLLFVTPEYNHGLPGVLKNAIDWCSQPAFRSVFSGKPIIGMGASPGSLGTVRAQGELLRVMHSMRASVFPGNAVLVGRAKEKFTDGVLTDDDTRTYITKQLNDFRKWAQR